MIPALTERVELVRKDLKEIPKEVQMYSKICDLNVSHNSIAEIPAFLPHLLALRSLRLAHNALTSFPDPILDMMQLQELSLSGNALGTVPAPLSRLSRLHRLALSNCRLETLPHALFRRMAVLKQLELADNMLTELPFLLTLQSLITLNLRNNRFTAFSSDLTRLRSHRQSTVMLEVLPNARLLPANSSRLERLRLRVPMLRDLCLTVVVRRHEVDVLKNLLPLDLWESITVSFHVCDGRVCEKVLYGVRYSAIILANIQHVKVPVRNRYCSYECVPKKITREIDKVEAAKRRVQEARTKTTKKKPVATKRIRRDDSPDRRI